MGLFLDERLRNRFTQKQLGEVIGKTQQYISAIDKIIGTDSFLV